MTIGQRLKTLRQEKGYTQDYLAKELLLSRQTIINWEKDKTMPDSDNLTRLSTFYQVSVDDLLGLARSNEVLMPSSHRHLKHYVILLVVLVLGCLIAVKGIPLIPLILLGLLIVYIWSEVCHTKS